MDTTTLAVVVVIAALLVIAALVLMRRNRSRDLQQRFGPEYTHAVDALGSRSKAEAELAAREKRVSRLHIVPLTSADAARFTEGWKSLQARFIDDPRGVLMDADRLVSELMLKRGYPMSDFEERAADISVDHPAVVEHYRAAHAVALLDRDGRADTEALRQAVVHYRALFADLLEVAEPAPAVREAPARGFFGVRGEHAMAREPARGERRGTDRPR